MSDAAFIEKCRSIGMVVRGHRKGRDANYVPPSSRIDVSKTWGKMTPSKAEAVEKRYFDRVLAQRKQPRPKNALVSQVAAIPPDLYFGKIKETRDRNYWKEKKNLRNHKEVLIRPNDI